MSSSLRNAVQRRNHRERAQPLDRTRLGLLEKHKDYALRARDHRAKQETLKRLRQEAAQRNDDEFYFGMLSRKGAGSVTTRGKEGFTGEVGEKSGRGRKGAEIRGALEVDAVRKLKTQDIAYIRMVRGLAQKEVDQLEEQIHLAKQRIPANTSQASSSATASLLSGIGPTKKIVFVDDEDEEAKQLVAQAKAQAKSKKQSHNDGISDDDDDDDNDEVDDWGLDDDEDLGLGDDDDGDDDDDVEGDPKEEESEEIQALRHQLKIAQKKLKALTQAEEELNIQRAKMAKTSTSGGVTKTGKKIVVYSRKK